MNSTVKQLLIWVVAVACLLVGWQFVLKNMNAGHNRGISLTELQNDADSGKIADVTVAGTEASG